MNSGSGLHGRSRAGTRSTKGAARHRPLTSALVASALASVLVGLTAGPGSADSAPQDPTDPGTPVTVTADALPTVQINGVVWSQAVVGNRVYAGGSFSTARPAGSAAGTNTVTRSNLLAYDLQTGELISSFAPSFNAQVRTVAVSPDQSRVYVGGDFTSVDGVRRSRIAAFDTATGRLVETFSPPIDYHVHAIAATNSTVYVGGNFTGVGNQERGRLAAFRASDGALLGWAPQANSVVWALTISPDGSKIAVGGEFTQLNGSSDPGYGLGMVSATTGASLPFAVNSVVRDATVDGAITTLASDGQYVYGGGYTFGKSGGTLEGVFAAGWDGGKVHWINDCHGDTYSVHPQGDVIYQVGHSHYCENIDGFRQGAGNVGSYPYNRGTAMSRAATGTATWEPDQGRYYNFEGQPTPSQLTWFPSINAGTYTGQSQGPWSVAGNADYVVMGGEFTRVNGQAQQGLVRFATREIAPNDQGPRLFNGTYPIKVTSAEAGKVRISWGANFDYDNDYLTYRVYRDDQDASGLVHTRRVRARYWNLPTMGASDEGLQPGSTHRYRVVVTDPFGNVANSPWTEVDVASSGSEDAYVRAVLDSEPDHYWRLGGDAGSVGTDAVAFRDLQLGTGVVGGAAGAVGDSDSAAHFDGSSSGFAATATLDNPPDVFTVEAWFKTTSTTGGKVVGWGNRNSRSSSKADRHIYLDDSGRVHFGVKPDATRQDVVSGSSYNDGSWHQATASLGPDGMKLYVDGVRVAQRSDVTVGEHLAIGYWRVGGDTLASWPSAPSTPFFTGDIDDVAVYKTVLSDAEVAAHYAAATTTTQPPVNVAPTAAFHTSVDGLSVSLDGSASTDSDGEVVRYAWDFGDGQGATGAGTSHEYAAEGTYTVTLTVTDDDGASASQSGQVTVSDPPGGAAPYAVDTFERSVTDGWGVAETGGSWSRSGSARNFSVVDGSGRIRMSSAGAGPSAFLPDVSSTDTEVRVQLSLDKLATGGGTYLTVHPRRVSAGDLYFANVRYLSSGAVAVILGRAVGDVETTLARSTLAGVTHEVGDTLQTRVQATGTSPTVLRIKAWETGAPEPAAWTASVTDSTAALQEAGAVGLKAYLSGSATNAPVLGSFDDLWAGPAG